MTEWERLTADGRASADRLITEMISTQNPTPLMNFVRELVARGTITAVEVGFFYMIAIRIILRK